MCGSCREVYFQTGTVIKGLQYCRMFDLEAMVAERTRASLQCNLQDERKSQAALRLDIMTPVGNEPRHNARSKKNASQHLLHHGQISASSGGTRLVKANREYTAVREQETTTTPQHPTCLNYHLLCHLPMARRYPPHPRSGRGRKDFVRRSLAVVPRRRL